MSVLPQGPTSRPTHRKPTCAGVFGSNLGRVQMKMLPRLHERAVRLQFCFWCNSGCPYLFQCTKR